MSNDREDHFNAVGFAGLEVNEVEATIHVAMEKAEATLGTIANAVGSTPWSEAGQNALAAMGEIHDRLGEMLGACEHVKAELIRYGNGF